MLCGAGGCERAHPGDPVHLQRAARVSRLLAHLLHNGSAVFRRQVLEVPEQQNKQAGPVQRSAHQRGVRVLRATRQALQLGKLEDQLRQRNQLIPRSSTGFYVQGLHINLNESIRIDTGTYVLVR